MAPVNKSREYAYLVDESNQQIVFSHLGVLHLCFLCPSLNLASWYQHGPANPPSRRTENVPCNLLSQSTNPSRPSSMHRMQVQVCDLVRFNHFSTLLQNFGFERQRWSSVQGMHDS